jgi:hypothetical protein
MKCQTNLCSSSNLNVVLAFCSGVRAARKFLAPPAMVAEDFIFWYALTVQVANMMTANPTMRASWFSFIGNSPREEYSQTGKNVDAAIRKYGVAHDIFNEPT